MALLRSLIMLAIMAFSAPASAPALADEPPSDRAKQVEQFKAAWDAAKKAAMHGPAEIKLLDQASLKLTEGEMFVPSAEANQIMKALGNGTTPARFGLVTDAKSDSDWMIDVIWVQEGYVRDGDAREWQADALLESLREGTESDNTERAARGIPALDIIGWIEPPVYDGAAHRLVWSLSARDHGAPAAEPQTINYNTYALGRDGFFSLGLITDSTSIDSDKTIVRELLQTLTYNPGKRYEDFSASTDKVAAYGLAALVGAVAVKKLGLLALAGVFLLKIWKIGLLVIAGAWAAVRRIFKKGGPPGARS
jgi:uncharacterized membrane-anchored protein